MRSRFPAYSLIGLVLIWAVLLGLPSLRSQLQQEVSTGKYSWPRTFASEEQINLALKATPNDPFILSQKLESQRPFERPDDSQFFRDYDALIAKNPKRLDLIRNRLRFSTRGNIVRYPVSNKYFQREDPRYRFSQNKLWLDDRELEKVVSLARQAQRLAPNDAFAYWLEAMAQSGLRHDQEVLSALQKAGNCSTFDDGVADNMRQRIAFREKWGRVEWDNKLLSFWAGLFPHYAGMRTLTREITYRGVDQYQAGNKAEAWRLWNIAFRAGRAMRVGQSQGPQANFIGLLVGEALESTLWYLVDKNVLGLKQVEYEASLSNAQAIQRTQTQANLFARLAQRDQQPELAALVLEEKEAIVERRSDPVLRGDSKTFQGEIGWPTPAARASVQMYWLGRQVLILACCGVLGWLLAFWAERGEREPRVGKNTIWSLSAFFVMLWGGLLIWACIEGAGAGRYMMLWGLQSNEEDLRQFPLAQADLRGGIWWFVGATFIAIWIWQALFGRRKRKTGNTGSKGFDFWYRVQFLAWLGLFAPSVFLWASAFNEPYDPNLFRVFMPFWTVGVALALFAGWRMDKTRSGEERPTFPFALNVALFLGASVLSVSRHSDFYIYLGILAGIAASVLLIWNLKANWHRKAFKVNFGPMQTQLAVCGRVIMNLALAFSLAYLFASFALLPTRARLERNVDRYVQLGDVDWMRAQSRAK